MRRYSAMAIVLLATLWAFDAVIGDAQAELESLRETINRQVGSSDAVQKNLLDPVLNGGEMTAIDGATAFTHQGPCQHSANFLDIVAFPSATGDITVLNIQQDTDWDGELDQLTQIRRPISGVCANGILSCDPGTWDNCQAYRWMATETGNIALAAAPLSTVGGCYCINASCGQALMLNNASEVLSHLGGAIVSVLGASQPTLMVSDNYTHDTRIKFMGGLSERCHMDGVADQASFYHDPSALQGAAAQTSTLDSLFDQVTTGAAATDSAMTTHTCHRNRLVQIDEVTAQEVVLYDGGAGGVQSCGSGCIDIVLGTVGDNYWHGGSCGLFEHQVNFWVEQPDRILSATLKQAKFDDHIQISSNDTYIWSHEAAWTELSATSYPPSTIWAGGNPHCERSTSWHVYPNIDFTDAIKVHGPHNFSIRVAVSGGGEGYAYARLMVDESCQLQPDSIQDTCSAYANDPDCRLFWASVDGITTVSDYSPTGLRPLPTTQTVRGASCALPAERPWWRQERIYKCRAQTSYDFDGILTRKSTISGSASASGYDDLRFNEHTQTWVRHRNIQMQYPTFNAVAGCEKSCKTRRVVEADEVAGMEIGRAHV